MSTPVWQPGTLYLPGAITTPRTTDVVITEQPNNNSFEDGLTHWNITGEACSDIDAQAAAAVSTSEAFDGAQSATVEPLAGDGTGPQSPAGKPVAFVIFTNDFLATVTPGQKIDFKCRFWHLFVPNVADVYAFSGGCRIAWFDASHTFIKYSFADTCSAGIAAPTTPGMFAFQDGVWVTISGTGVAPAGAAYAAAVAVIASTDYSSQAWYADEYTWDYTHQGFPSGLVFVATQAGPGTSASVEPAWPVNVGGSVQDGGVTWEGEDASQITWTAQSILTSGGTEPVWPLTVGGAVADDTIEWIGTDGRVTDPNCPQSKIVMLGASKVFAADGDIVKFSATTNAQDWSSSNDAGFIPFGLNTYGNEPISAMGLYRSNLVIANSLGYQMWQIDPDPANIAILDAEPVGFPYNKTLQPVNNDLVGCTQVGLRNIGTAGAAGNMQAGQFGKNVDPIVKALLKQVVSLGYEPRALFNPGTGQYFLLIGPSAVILTINGASTMSWSRYLFPDTITDWTILSGQLYLRAGDLVWRLSADTLLDDTLEDSTQGGTNAGYRGYVAWHYCDFGPIGYDKDIEGFDLTIGKLDEDYTQIVSNDITCNITFGYNQSNLEEVTEPYTVDGDTVPGTMIPMPLIAPTLQLRLDFGTGQDWGWAATNIYITGVLPS